ncbi:MAG: hypothetical protein ABSB76_35975 [Streptosporangiaceae bacterium]
MAEYEGHGAEARPGGAGLPACRQCRRRHAVPHARRKGKEGEVLGRYRQRWPSGSFAAWQADSSLATTFRSAARWATTTKGFTSAIVKLQPRLPYNLIGHNCEIIANMCASGSWSESYQTRQFFTVRTAMDISLMLYIASAGRRNLPIPRWVRIVAICGFAATFAVKTTYDDQIRRLWKEIRDDWEAHERLPAGDPRNGLPR